VILRSVFQGNVGNGGGGALHNSGLALHLESCLFTDNESDHYAAAIYNDGTMTLAKLHRGLQSRVRIGGGLYSRLVKSPSSIRFSGETPSRPAMAN